MTLQTFLIVDAAVVFLLIATDWLMGEKARKAIKDKVADWWYLVESLTWNGFGAAHAARMLQFMSRLLGTRGLSWRRFLSCSALSLALMLPVAALVMQLWPPQVAKPDAPASHQESIDWARNAGYVLFAAACIPTLLFSWLSLSATMKVLARMSRSAGPASLLANLLAVLAIAAGASIWLIPLVLVVAEFLQFLIFATAFGSPNAFTLFAGMLASIIAMLVTNFGPLVILIFSILFFLVSKLVRPAIQPVTSLVLARLYESKRSVLSQVAIGAGAVAALVKAVV